MASIYSHESFLQFLPLSKVPNLVFHLAGFLSSAHSELDLVLMMMNLLHENESCCH